MNPPPRWFCGTLLTAVFVLVGGLLFLSAMDRDLNHDEHQFIAPGVLISREGLLPYRDFPMFHLPNLAFIYATLDRLTHQPLFSAKAFNALTSTAAVTLILLAGITRKHPVPLAHRHVWYALAAISLLLTDQLFTYTIGKTWNHELPAFLLVAAILLHVRTVESGGWRWAALSGFCVGAAVGTRLTYLPVALAFPCLLAFAPLPRRDRVLALAAWSGAWLVSITPSIYFFCADRERFIFDNLEFPRLRLLDPTDTRAQKTMTWWRKVRYFFKEIVAHSLPLVIAFIIASIEPIRRRLRQREPISYGHLVCMAVLPLAILGCFLPSRYQYQHYFAVAPLLTLGLTYALRSWQEQIRWYGSVAILVALLFGLSSLNTHSAKRSGGFLAYKDVPAMLDPAKWFTNKLRADYDTIATESVPQVSEHVDIGYQPPGNAEKPILTLAPIGVLEAGGKIYSGFATGPFAWRSASLMDRQKRMRMGLPAPEDLDDLLKREPPRAILTGVEDEDLEKPFISYAKSNGLRATPVGKRRILWMHD